ncbi:unnamed protein product, partial [Haemonchus placei]|uniref:ShTK domain protein n=1 Tax=Haemonchus placei TaxID=6290 RepID=A0A0N4W7P6_HAEPC
IYFINEVIVKWSERALGCENSVSDAICDSIVASQTPLTFDFQLSSADSEEKKQAMIKMCPKTCGYCCLTDAYNCVNREFPGVTCSSLTQAQCKDPKWREIIARDCPNVCGFCLEGGCVDAAIECANDKSICRNVDMQAFTMANCKKTCGYCDNVCECASWKTNGFCDNQFYTIQQKKQNCAKTCGLCN